MGSPDRGRARNRGIQLALIRDGETVLEVAVGTGLILADVVRQNPGGFSAGIDISEGMLQKAREKLGRTPARVELKYGSALQIPYPADTFDLLINGYMFDLMPFAAMPCILSEFRRVLKPAGRVVLIDMTLGERPGSQLFEWLANRFPALMGGCRGVRLAGPLEQAGFRVLVREYHQQLLFPSEVILAEKA